MRIVHIYIVCVGENVTHNTHLLDDRKELCPLDSTAVTSVCLWKLALVSRWYQTEKREEFYQQQLVSQIVVA